MSGVENCEIEVRLRRWSRLLICLGVGLGGWACGESSLKIHYRSGMNADEVVAEPDVTADAGPEDASLDEDLAGDPVSVTRLEPATGPAQGGIEAKVIGSGFTAGCRVRIGDATVPEAQTEVLNGNEIRVVVPAGEPGVVDVRVALPTGEALLLPGGFRYHALNLTPREGATTGGTMVEVLVSGEPPDSSAELLFGGTACNDLEFVAPGRLRCRTPPGMVGAVDVLLREPDAPEQDRLAAGAFTYLTPTAGTYGGLSGDAIAGTVNILVVQEGTQRGLPGVQLLLGDDPASAPQAVTDAEGRAVLSAAELSGPVTLHAARDCYVRASLHAFDAQNVTLFMAPSDELRCQVDPEEQEDLENSNTPFPGAVLTGTASATVSGELLFPGPREFQVNAWDVVPRPRANEFRVTYIYATRSQVFASDGIVGRVSPLQRITENTALIGKRGGYVYSIYARPAGMSVYALSGLERADTGAFVPYVMGLVRNVVTAPGEDLEGVDIVMDIPLDQQQDVVLEKVPPGTDQGPLEFRVQLHIDLGAEGVIMRQVQGELFDLRRSLSAQDPFSFYAQPALEGQLADARYALLAGWYSGNSYSQLPYTEALRLGVEQSDSPLVVDDLLGIPVAESPRRGARLPEDRVLRWRAEGAVPDLYWVRIYLPNGTPIWGHICPGDTMQVAVPDFSTFEELSDLPAGFLFWTVRGIRVPGFEYDRFSYSDLDTRKWTHDAIDDFVFSMP